MSQRSRSLLVAVCAVSFLALAFQAPSQISWTGPPKAEAHRRKAAEGFPPLPLPATPLRRTEKKRPPAPPTLMAKITYGSQPTVKADGSESWDTSTPGDTKEVFRFARARIGVNYKADVIPLGKFHYQPERVPIIYFSGREPIRFSDYQKERLRLYVQQGGCVFADMSNGSATFAKSYRAEMQSIFPERPWRPLPKDHPVFRSHFGLAKIEVTIDDQKKQAEPYLEGIDVGFRTAVMFSPYAVNFGWTKETAPDAPLVTPGDANKLGVNFLTYVLAYYRVGRVQSVATVFSETDPGVDDIAIAQLRHGGDWDPDPTGLSYLLRAVGEQTTGDVKFRRYALDPEDGKLFDYPFVYLTGQSDFAFTKQGRENLAKHLAQGGFLLIVNASHRVAFDRAVRRELKGLLPKSKLTPLAKDHSLFTVHNKIAAEPPMIESGGAKPQISVKPEGCEVDGRLAVLYLPIPVGAAWQDAELPFVPTPDHRYALELGVNTVVYAMTH